MSLLLDALKKAEKAKEQAQRQAQDERAGTSAPDAGSARPVRTRNELPEISQSLEISDEDIGAQDRGRERRPALALELEKPEPKPEPKPESSPRSTTPSRPARESAPAPGGASQAANRATAQRVFEAKFREPNPRLPFYITLAVLGVLGLGTAIYFWYQLRPPPSLVNAHPQRPANERAIAAAAPAGAPAGAPVAAQSLAATSAAPVIPGLPPSAAPTPAAPPAATPGAPATGAKAAVPPASPSARTEAPAPEAPAARPAPRAESAAPRAAEPARGPIRPQRPRPAPKVNPQVASGYQAYQAGDLAVARSDYEQALRAEPMNRDALLGLAAVEMKAQRYEQAETYYQRLLQANPRDPDAQAGMLALRAQLIDPVVAESRLKTLLTSNPQAEVLYFTLGNEYALQARWGEARQAYARALAADPDNPDFAYNVAVSLDHLGESALALSYYRQALALAGKRAASFDARAAQERVQQLSH